MLVEEGGEKKKNIFVEGTADIWSLYQISGTGIKNVANTTEGSKCTVMCRGSTILTIDWIQHVLFIHYTQQHLERASFII